MADLVRYLGEFPTDLGWGMGGGVDSTHPAPVPVDQIHAWWWNAKNWTVTSDIVLVSTFSGSPLSYSLATGAMTRDGANATRELDLTLPTNPHDFNVVDANGNCGLSMLATLAPAINDDGTSKYPNFTLNANVTDPTDPTTTMSGRTDGGPGTLVDLVVSGINGASDVIIPSYWQTSGSGSFSGSFIQFQATEFWPYDDGGGNPIHDTSTNAVVGNPNIGVPSTSPGGAAINCYYTSGGIRYYGVVLGTLGSAV